MKAGDVMTAGAATIRENATIAEAARLMVQHRVSGLPVVDDGDKLIGMITEGDLLRRIELGTERQRPAWVELWLSPSELADEYARARGRRVKEVMTSDIVSVGPETPLEEVATIMEREGYKRLPVVRDGQIVGVVSRANFLLALSRRVAEIAASQQDDLSIRRSILDEVAAQRWSSLAMVEVEVENGAVRLHGSVEDERVRKAVVVAAENVAGVRSVEDNLVIAPFKPAYI